jgi:DNA-binding MarR family transcriptional regulator
MDNRDIKTLQILETISHDETVSQRTLARTLDVSLGLVNSFIKHLTVKGFFKIKYLPKDRVRYIITPEGASEKTRLAYNYIKHSFSLYKKSYGIIRDMLQNLAKEGIRNVALFGSGVISEMIVHEMTKLGLNVTAVIDDSMKGTAYLGIPVMGTDEIRHVEFDRIIVAEYDHQEYSMDALLNAGVPEYRIVRLDHSKYI